MLLFLFLPFLLATVQASDTSRSRALESLANAERNFSATSEVKGYHQAFVEHLADDGIVFAPKPTNGKKLHAAAPASKALLTWYPAYADISSSLDWGYTTGPYQLKLSPEDDTLAGAGFYLSVWRRQPDGQWKVVVDMGNSFSPELLKEEPYQPIPAPKGKTMRGAEEELLNADLEKVQPYDAETLLYRHGKYPYKYKTANTKPASNVAYTNLGHALSPAADMAYTYGSYTRGAGAQAETGYYLKVWKVLDGEWKLAAHNLVPNRKP